MRRALAALPLAFLLAACGGHSTAQNNGVSEQRLQQMEQVVGNADTAANQADQDAAQDR